MPIFGKLDKKMHPVHVVLVHFPSAVYQFSLLMEGLGLYYENQSFAASAYYAFLFAFSTGLLAAVFGIMDYLKLEPESKAFSTATTHGGLNVLWIIGFGVLLKLRYNYAAAGEGPSWLYLLCFGLLTLGMMYSNHLGGDLVFKYGIGRREEYKV